jgi:hypothetical protein
MYWIRIGSLLDLSIIASEDTTHNAAKILGIPNSTLAGYITGVRNIKESAVEDMASRWTKYFSSNIRPLIKRWKDDQEDKLDFSQADIFGLYFEELFEVENRLRLICEPEPWRNPFSCCAAQVLAQFEADHPDAAGAFTKEDALQLLRLTILHHRPYNELNHRKLLRLALQYVLWRVKNRENFMLERFGKNPKSFEVRDQRDIPLLSEKEQDGYLNFPADHRFYIHYSDEGIDFPDTPRLKKAATMDILMLCQKVRVEINHVVNDKVLAPFSFCSCISPFGKEINFAAAEAPR